MSESNLYHYRCELRRCVDGDTVDIEIDLGLRLKANVRCRLYGIDTPERGQPGYHEATDYLISRTAGVSLGVDTHKDPDNFGRWLVVLWREGDVSINQEMIDKGYAKVYRR